MSHLRLGDPRYDGLQSARETAVETEVENVELYARTVTSDQAATTTTDLQDALCSNDRHMQCVKSMFVQLRFLHFDEVSKHFTHRFGLRLFCDFAKKPN